MTDLHALSKSLYRRIPTMPRALRGEQRDSLLKAIPYQMARLSGR